MLRNTVSLFVCLFTCLVPELSMAEQWLYLGDGFQSTTGYLGAKASYQSDIGSDSNELLSNDGTTTSAIGRVIHRNNWQGFIYRPWITSTTLTTELQADYNQYDIQEGGNQSLLAGLLSTSVNLYPHSDYPTTFIFNQYVKKSSGSGDVDDNLLFDTLFSVKNHYQPEDETYSALTQYTFAITDESKDARSYVQNAFDFTGMDEGEGRNYSGMARLNNENRNYLDRNNEHNDASLQFQQFWVLNEGDSINLFADITRENDIEQGDINTRRRDYERAQLTATSFMRSATDDRITYSFNGFANQTNNSISGIGQVEHRSINLSAGSFYDYSDQIRFVASLDGLVTNSNNEKTEFISGFGAINYQDQLFLSDSVLLSWFVNDSVSLLRGDEKENINSIQFGDGLSKDFSLFDTNLTVSLDQTVNHEISSIDEGERLLDEWQLNHDLALNWSSNSGTVNSVFYLLLSDSRHLTEDKRQFQHAYLSLQRNQILSNADNWGGNLVYEWNKTINELGEQESYAQAFGMLWYRNIELWDVEALRFTSTLTLPLNDLLPDDELRANDIASWENALDYRVGLLEIRLNSVTTENSYYVAFEVKRNF